jgi:hypothetical protein
MYILRFQYELSTSLICNNRRKFRKSRLSTIRVHIPVRADAAMLPNEENTLAVFKYRLQYTPPPDRWYPVLERYIALLSAKVDGLGGIASQIPALAFDCFAKSYETQGRYMRDVRRAWE